MQAAEMQLERVVCHAENSGSVVPFPRFVPAAKSSAFQEIMRRIQAADDQFVRSLFLAMRVFSNDRFLARRLHELAVATA
jgi:hypothetical protein